VWSVGLVVVAVVVFAVAGYVLVHDDPVHRAGRTPRLPAAASISTPGSPSSSSTSGSGSSTAPSKADPVVAFLGDDWTSGTGASGPAKRFTTLVSAALHLQERNFGVAGSGYAKQGRSGGDYASRVDDVVAAQPAMVIVSGGRNDVHDKLSFAAHQARQLFEQLRARLPGAVVIAVAPMWGDSAAPTDLRRVARAVRKAAERVGARYLGVTDPTRGHPGFMADDAHPDDRGYAAIATVLERRLAPYVPS
jgi:lysophospholipase L1-like esterase